MNCNILLLGQTGVGKSSLLNYLAGKELAEAGITSGVGGLTRGINKYPLNINGQDCVVSDSEGLETANSDFWVNLIEKNLFANSSNKSLSEWYHIIVYCVGANCGRVQDFELDILDRIINAGYGVIIAFTKVDVASEDELEALESAIIERIECVNQLSFVKICSRKTRYSLPEGKEDLCNAIVDSWGESILNRLPAHIYDSVFPALEKWYESVFDWLVKQKIGLFNWGKEELLEELNKRFRKQQESINSGISKRLKNAFSEIKGVYGSLSQVIDIYSLSGFSEMIAPKLEKLESAYVFDNHSGRNSVLAGVAAVGMMAIPILTVPMAISGVIMRLVDKNKRYGELIDAFNYQYRMLIKALCESRDLLSFMLAEEMGYLFGARETALCYLKGRGVEEDFSSFYAHIMPLVSWLEKNEGECVDGRAEYYIAYMYFAMDELKEGNKWIKRSFQHGYPDAHKVFIKAHSGDMFGVMKELETSNEREYLESWFIDNENN